MRTIERKQLHDDLVQTLSSHADVPAAKIELGDNIYLDLGLDSVKSMEVMAEIAELYGVDPEVEVVTELETVGEILDYMLAIANDQAANDHTAATR